MTKDQQVEFWDNKAQTFPRYEEAEDNYEAGMLKIIKDHGVCFKDADVLDVGCGSGMYTIRIAKEAANVTATDISGEMLRIMKQDAEIHCVDNISTVHSDWESFSGDKKFDIVFCSMSPASGADWARQKLTDYSKKWCVYMGFSGKMDSEPLRGLFSHYGIEQADFSDSLNMKEWLDKNKYKYTACPVKGEWVTPRNRDDMFKNTYDMMSRYGVELNADHIKNHIEQFRDENGMYIERTKYEIEVVIWEK